MQHIHIKICIYNKLADHVSQVLTYNYIRTYIYIYLHKYINCVKLEHPKGTTPWVPVRLFMFLTAIDLT